VEERVPESAIAPQEPARESSPAPAREAATADDAATREPVAQPRTARAAEPVRHTPSKLDLLDQGIEGLSRLEREPLGRPISTPEQPMVSVEALTYRGRAAVRRAIELREELRRGGGSPSAEAVEELFDLMDLALLDEALV
jgi:hypothetical protein